jgi:predicted peroxiredoxin
MDLMLICRDGLANSFASNLLSAIDAKKAGMDVGIIFTQEALRCVAGEAPLRWSPALSGQEMRLRIADTALAQGLPILGGKGEGRELDAIALIAQAKEAGVSLFGCPLWAEFLGYDQLPEGITILEHEDALKQLGEAKKIIGTL